jgi:hypothetical protein
MEDLVASGVAVVAGVGLGYLLDITFIAWFCFIVQWIAMSIHALPFNSEKYYDLIGGSTFAAATVLSLLSKPSNFISYRQLVCSSVVLIWSGRIASFLYNRIRTYKKDRRFDYIKKTKSRFAMAWTIQGLWILVTACPVFVINSRPSRVPLGLRDVLGLSIWILGFATEVIADNQKAEFKANPKNQDKFIQTGLWKYSRHRKAPVRSSTQPIFSQLLGRDRVVDWSFHHMQCRVFWYAMVCFVFSFVCAFVVNSNQWTSFLGEDVR